MLTNLLDACPNFRVKQTIYTESRILNSKLAKESGIYSSSQQRQKYVLRRLDIVQQTKMTEIVRQEESLAALNGKVVVISGLQSLALPSYHVDHFLTPQTGSARGIGAATVTQLYHAGAHVVHGDWDAEGGQSLNANLLASPGRGSSHFVKTDVTDYDSVLNLFEVAWKRFARVDISISNAGIQEIGNWFDPSLDRESIKTVCDGPHFPLLP
jgi:hypothetical protein